MGLAPAMAASRPSTTFWRTESELKSSAFWNVRPSPKRARPAGPIPVTSRLCRRTLPAVGLTRPEQALKVVVLPAPFGPTNPVIRAIGASRLTLSTARTPPNRTDSPRTARPALSETPAVRRRAISRSARALCFSSAAASTPALRARPPPGRSRVLDRPSGR